MLILSEVRQALGKVAGKKGNQKYAATAALLMYLVADEDWRLAFRQAVMALESGRIHPAIAEALGLEASASLDAGDLNGHLATMIRRRSSRKRKGGKRAARSG